MSEVKIKNWCGISITFGHSNFKKGVNRKKSNKMEKRLLNIKETAEYLGLKVNTLYCWVSQKRIPYVKMGKKLMFDIECLDKFIEENAVEPINFEKWR